MRSLISSGRAFMRIDITIVLTQTDLPEPVAPAIRQCGILARSENTHSPLIAFPKKMGMASFFFFLIVKDHLLKTHLLRVNGWDFHTNRGFTGNGSHDTDRFCLHIERNIVFKSFDLLYFHSY